ncbi:MAG: T9SS type A sorting domain-containing protein [Bacteroidota bacterium]
MKRNIRYTIAIISISILLTSWGYTGHKKISYNCIFSFNPEMSQFLIWATQLQDHASDADDRKSIDKTEGHKHFIDIDNYDEFKSNHKIPQNYDTLVALHGEMFVSKQGILPFTTKTTFDTLVNCFKRRDWDKAMLTAADLGHYVGDGHMPLHTTNNYDGKFTNQSGIHSRYESRMVDDHIKEFLYSIDTISYIHNVTQYIFNYIYFNNKYVDSVLQADTYATQIAGNTNSTAYTDALWGKTKNYTIMLFKNASHSLAELLYTAWVDAGKPLMNQQDIALFNTNSKISLQIIPNPIKNTTKIQYSLKNSEENLALEIKDEKGNTIDTLFKGKKAPGVYQTEWSPSNTKSGVYFVTLKTSNSLISDKIISIN